MWMLAPKLPPRSVADRTVLRKRGKTNCAQTQGTTLTNPLTHTLTHSQSSLLFMSSSISQLLPFPAALKRLNAITDDRQEAATQAAQEYLEQA